jgi:hypothetical protein
MAQTIRAMSSYARRSSLSRSELLLAFFAKTRRKPSNGLPTIQVVCTMAGRQRQCGASQRRVATCEGSPYGWALIFLVLCSSSFPTTLGRES